MYVYGHANKACCCCCVKNGIQKNKGLDPEAAPSLLKFF